MNTPVSTHVTASAKLAGRISTATSEANKPPVAHAIVTPTVKLTAPKAPKHVAPNGTAAGDDARSATFHPGGLINKVGSLFAAATEKAQAKLQAIKTGAPTKATAIVAKTKSIIRRGRVASPAAAFGDKRSGLMNLEWDTFAKNVHSFAHAIGSELGDFKDAVIEQFSDVEHRLQSDIDGLKAVGELNKAAQNAASAAAETVNDGFKDLRELGVMPGNNALDDFRRGSVFIGTGKSGGALQRIDVVQLLMTLGLVKEARLRFVQHGATADKIWDRMKERAWDEGDPASVVGSNDPSKVFRTYAYAGATGTASVEQNGTHTIYGDTVLPAYSAFNVKYVVQGAAPTPSTGYVLHTVIAAGNEVWEKLSRYNVTGTATTVSAMLSALGIPAAARCVTITQLPLDQAAPSFGLQSLANGALVIAARQIRSAIAVGATAMPSTLKSLFMTEGVADFG